MSHVSILEQLRNKAERFRKQGRLQNQDLEKIIKEIKEGEEFKAKGVDAIAETAVKDKHKRILEAVKDGLLQVHGTAPNTKQQGIFCTMGENCNGLNNRIRGNGKIAKALAQCGLFCVLQT